MSRNYRYRKAYAYAACGIISVLGAFVIQRLWQADIRFPLRPMTGEALYTQALVVKGWLENSTFFDNVALGAPLGLGLQEYPQADCLVFGLVKLLGLFTKNHFLIANLISITSYPLVALVSLHVLRRLGVRDLLAVVASLLFAFLSFHSIQLATQTLAGIEYFTVPVAVYLAFQLFEKEAPLFLDGRSYRDLRVAKGRPTWAAAAACVLLGATGGSYFPLFSCYVLLWAGVLASFRSRTLLPAMRSACMAAIVGTALAITFLPALVHAWKHGCVEALAPRGATGLSLAQLVSPSAVRQLNEQLHLSGDTRFLTFVRQGSVYLGAIAAFGFIFMLFMLLRGGKQDPRDRALSRLNGAVLLLGVGGGFCTLLSSPTSRNFDSYRYLCTYLAFFSLLGLARLVQGWLPRWETTRLRRVTTQVALAAIVTLGFLDQRVALDYDYTELRARTLEQRTFVKKLERRLPHGSSIFQFPNIPFPERDPTERLGLFEQLIPYLHSTSLHFSYGAAGARRAGDFNSRLATLPPDQAVDNLILAGFSGIHVARRGYADRGAQLEESLKPLLGRPTLIDRDTESSFYSLVNRRDKLRNDLGEKGFERRRTELMSSLYWGWLDGCHRSAPRDGAPRVRCGSKFRFVLENPSSSATHVVIEAKLQVARFPTRIRIKSEQFNQDLVIARGKAELSEGLDLAPGEHIFSAFVDGSIISEDDGFQTYLVLEDPHFSSIVR